jgi:hypothetical protein
LIQETPVLKTVKDWIAADVETWEKVLKNKDDGSYHVTVSEEEVKHRKKRKRSGVISLQVQTAQGQNH